MKLIHGNADPAGLILSDLPGAFGQGRNGQAYEKTIRTLQRVRDEIDGLVEGYMEVARRDDRDDALRRQRRGCTRTGTILDSMPRCREPAGAERSADHRQGGAENRPRYAQRALLAAKPLTLAELHPAAMRHRAMAGYDCRSVPLAASRVPTTDRGHRPRRRGTPRVHGTTRAGSDCGPGRDARTHGERQEPGTNRTSQGGRTRR